MSFIFSDVLCGFVTKGLGASGFRLPKLSMGYCINGTLQKHHISIQYGVGAYVTIPLRTPTLV